VFKLNEGADGVSIAICAQKHGVQASIFLHRLKHAYPDTYMVGSEWKREGAQSRSHQPEYARIDTYMAERRVAR
jgi:hypothetical protein